MKKVGLFIMALATAICANATDLKGLKIYVNPGHGGHDSDDLAGCSDTVLWR